MKIEYRCKIGHKNCDYIIEVKHFNELIERIKIHEINEHNKYIPIRGIDYNL